MRLSLRQLNRATLARQALLRREPLDAVGAVRRVVAIQAQDPASPYLALWARVADFDPAQLDDAFTARTVLKATLMRMTLHAVAAADYPAFHVAMQPTLRAARLNDRRHLVTGLSPAETDALVPEVQAFAAEQPRLNIAIETWLAERTGLPRPGAWWALRSYAPFVHAPGGGPWSFGQRPAFQPAPALERPADPEVALQQLIRRYLEGFGPASVADIARFALLQRSRASIAVAALSDALSVLEGPDGQRLLDVPGGLLPREDTPAPARLLPMWDSILLAYADRGRVIPPDLRPLVTRTNGDVLPTLLVDGFVAGVWRATPAGIEVTAYRDLRPGEWAQLEAEAADLRAFLAPRDPVPYGRQHHWWTKLPPGEVRLLGS